MAATVLIVDDEPANLNLLRQVLAEDYTLAFARSGSDALRAVHKHKPDLILLDVMMPDMDGYAVCRQLKADPTTAHIPVIFITALADAQDETAGFAVGAVDYIIKPISPPIVCARVRNHLSLVSVSQLEKSYHEAIGMLAEAGEYKDSDTGVHIWRMAAYSAALAAACDWSGSACEQLRLAAPMHDIGKIGIPDAVLHKPGKLDAEEWRIMQGHAEIGHHILARSQGPILQLAATIAHCHHEKWDGSGYPRGLRGEDIPEAARIVAIADVFDALTMNRPYKDAWPIERVVNTMQADAGTHFDPRLIARFLHILPEILAIKADWDQRANRAEVH